MEITKSKIAFFIIIILILIYCYSYASNIKSEDKKNTTHKTLTEKMQISGRNGLVRGCITGLLLSGPEYAVLSSIVLFLVNPIMVFYETLFHY